jgi:dTDP-4-dehydrorhamnose reductase
MRNSVLITGGSGLLGVNWGIIERERNRVILGLHKRQVTLAGVETRPIQLESTDDVLRALDETLPHLVVHTAGLTSVEACESAPQLAREVNVEMAANVARACAQRQVFLVHISTDHLFSGDQPFADEDRPVSPLNVYAATKAAAEGEVLAAHPKALVIRTNFYGWGPGHRRSFSDGIVRALRSGSEITLFHDVFFTPILIETLVAAVNDLVSVGAAGIFNVVGDERISKHAFGLALANQARLDPSPIKSGSIQARPGLVRRPLDMSLSNAKACARLGRKLGSIAGEVPRLFRQETVGLAQEIQNL